MAPDSRKVNIFGKIIILYYIILSVNFRTAITVEPPLCFGHSHVAYPQIYVAGNVVIDPRMNHHVTRKISIYPCLSGMLEADRPTVRPTDRPTVRPTDRQSVRPTNCPSVRPTNRPSVRPTDHPSVCVWSTDRPGRPTMGGVCGGGVPQDKTIHSKSCNIT